MYQLEPAAGRERLPGRLRRATLARFRRRALLVVLTELVEQAVGEFLAPALPLICARHLVVIGAVQDPEVLAWANATPTEHGGGLPQGGGGGRPRTSGAAPSPGSGASGATVVDAAPGRLAPQLADAYLKVKATGRL